MFRKTNHILRMEKFKEKIKLSILRLSSLKITWECFEKKITYAEWVNFEKHPNYEYLTFQL